MIEIPESTTISRQATDVLKDKIVADVINATSPHRFAWFNGDATKYPELLIGKAIESVNGYGSFIDIRFNEDTHLAIGDGTHMTPPQRNVLLNFSYSSLLKMTPISSSQWLCMAPSMLLKENLIISTTVAAWKKPPRWKTVSTFLSLKA